MSLFTQTLDIGQDGCGTVIPCIDMEVGHVEIPYPECEMAMNTEGGQVVDSVSRIRNG